MPSLVHLLCIEIQNFGTGLLSPHKKILKDEKEIILHRPCMGTKKH